MDRTAYQKHLELDQYHFWRVAKRQLLKELLSSNLEEKKGLRILDIGGAVSLYPRTLAEFGEVTVVEPDAQCVEVARSTLKMPIVQGALPDSVGVDGLFDVISMLDVLEHIEDDRRALESVRSLLTEDGTVIMTVPALPILFSDHDRALHHFRRYTKKTLLEVINRSGLRIRRIGYWTSLLLPIIALQRVMGRLRDPLKKDHDVKYSVSVPSPFVNSTLSQVMKLERRGLRFVDFPLGSSLFAVLEKE